MEDPMMAEDIRLYDEIVDDMCWMNANTKAL